MWLGLMGFGWIGLFSVVLDGVALIWWLGGVLDCLLFRFLIVECSA